MVKCATTIADSSCINLPSLPTPPNKYIMLSAADVKPCPYRAAGTVVLSDPLDVEDSRDQILNAGSKLYISLYTTAIHMPQS